MAVRNWRTYRVARDTVLFSAGLIGIAHETFINHGERPSLLVLFAGMIGLPVFLRADEKGPKQGE